MASSIDATKPTAGAALTADVRNNFSAAKSEIEALQAAVASALVAKAGDTMTGALNWAATQTIASAATTDIGAATSNSVIVSGTKTITALGTIAAGAERVVQFSGELTLRHNETSLILPGGADINTAAGDVAYFVSLGSGNWRCTGYQKANGQAVVASGGASKQIQYNNAGTLDGVPQLEFDAATNELRLGVGLTYNNNTGTLTLRQKAGGVANLLEVRDSSGMLTMRVNEDGVHLAPTFIDPVFSLRATVYIENNGRYIDSALNFSSGGAGDVLIISTGSPATSKIATVSEREKTPLGVGATYGIPSWVSYRGQETVNADSGAISIGDRLVMSATTGGLVCADTTNNIALATVGYALTAKAGGSPGTITAWLHPTPGYKTLTVESLTTVGVVKQTVYTVATLPSASTSGNGARSHVSDALAPTFGATVAAGGSVSTPVYSDGTNWKVG